MSQPAPTNPNKDKPLGLEKIRPELNIEKWPLWKPASSKNPPRVREFEREIELKDGSKGKAKLTVGYTDKGDLTTEDQKTWYALIKDWEEKNRPEGLTSLSLRRLAKHTGRGWGTNVIDSITDSLRRLRVTPFSWENAYLDKTTGEYVEILDTFNILSELKIVKRKKDGIVKRELGYFRFNDFIIKNILANNTKPVLFQTVTSFKSEIAQLLYTHIDLIFGDGQTSIHARRTKELFDELGIIGKEYGYPSGRKRILERALKELFGKPLSSGGIIAAAVIEKTKDGKDYKVIFRKGAAPKSDAAGAEATPQTEGAEIPERDYRRSQKQPTPTEQKGEELVRYFYKVFFGVEATTPRSKHRDLAAALIARYGWDVAAHVIDFAYQEAQRTKFQIATFGGVVQYVDRAATDYDRRQKERERQAQAEAEASERRQAERRQEEAEKRAHERFTQLPEAERENLLAAERERLQRENPIWAKPDAHGNFPLLDSAARSAIIEAFMREESRGEGEDTGEETISSAIA